MMSSWGAKVTMMLGLRDGAAKWSAGHKGVKGALLNPLQAYKSKSGETKTGIPKTEDDYADPWDGKLPVWAGGISASDDVNELRTIGGVMTKEKAIHAIESVARNALIQFDLLTGVQNVRTYRKFIASAASRRIMAWEKRDAIERYLPMALMKKNRRAGRQKISTTSRRSNIPESGRFLFGGRTALKMPVGRPALPEDSWLARYFARKSRRQQRNATSIKRNRGLPTVPPTRYVRPRREEMLSP